MHTISRQQQHQHQVPFSSYLELRRQARGRPSRDELVQDVKVALPLGASDSNKKIFWEEAGEDKRRRSGQEEIKKEGRKEGREAYVIYSKHMFLYCCSNGIFFTSSA